MNQPIKIHGGKHYLAAKIVALFPKRYLTYCEPYFGGGSVLLRLQPDGHSEIANDLDGDLANFWGILSSDTMHKRLVEKLSLTPFSEQEFRFATNTNADDRPLQRAVNFFVRCRMSLAGRRKDFTAISSSRVRRGMNEQVSAWITAIDGLPEVYQRMRRVLVLSRPAVKLISQVDHKKTVFYCDPPYLQSTRNTISEYGEYEMSYADHVELLETLQEISGKFLLSGYDNDLYEQYRRKNKWKRHQFIVPNAAAGGAKKRRMVECVWTNY